MWARNAWLLLAAVVPLGCATQRVVYPVTLDCPALRMAPVINHDERLAFRGQGFSVLPPSGEHWCLDPTGVVSRLMWKMERRNFRSAAPSVTL